MLEHPTLRVATPSDWVGVALENFDDFLVDHALCERKASAVGMSFVARYPDRQQLMEPMIQFAREELDHFHQVYRLMEARGLKLTDDIKDRYVNMVAEPVRFTREGRFLDRLLVSSVIEARGHERLALVTEALEEPTLKAFYARLTRAEKRHTDLFIEMAELYFPADEIKDRLDFFLDVEAKAIQAVPYRSALH